VKKTIKINSKAGHILYSADGNTLVGANLRDTNLHYAYLPGVDLSYSDLRFSNLYLADLSNANLHGANLIEADLTRADLRGANLEDIIVNEYTVIDLNTKLDPEQLTYLILKGVYYFGNKV